ncbi:hypothetical protein LguiA_008131 [Lonicera macranthoides]
MTTFQAAKENQVTNNNLVERFEDLTMESFEDLTKMKMTSEVGQVSEYLLPYEFLIKFERYPIPIIQSDKQFRCILAAHGKFVFVLMHNFDLSHFEEFAHVEQVAKAHKETLFFIADAANCPEFVANINLDKSGTVAVIKDRRVVQVLSFDEIYEKAGGYGEVGKAFANLLGEHEVIDLTEEERNYETADGDMDREFDVDEDQCFGLVL